MSQPTSSILKLFARSPISPLNEHMKTAYECAKHLIPFIQAVIKDDWTEARKQQKQITKLEREADKLKKDLRLHLPKGIFMPVARSDMLELLAKQELLANRAQDIAGMMLGRHMQIPQSMRKSFIAYVKRTIDAAKQAKKAISELGQLFEAGFRGSEAKLVEAMITELDKIEQDTDQKQIELRHELYDLEKDLPPVDVMFLYKMLEWIGDLADYAQQVGGRLQLLMAR